MVTVVVFGDAASATLSTTESGEQQELSLPEEDSDTWSDFRLLFDCFSIAFRLPFDCLSIYLSRLIQELALKLDEFWIQTWVSKDILLVRWTQARWPSNDRRPGERCQRWRQHCL